MQTNNLIDLVFSKSAVSAKLGKAQSGPESPSFSAEFEGARSANSRTIAAGFEPVKINATRLTDTKAVITQTFPGIVTQVTDHDNNGREIASERLSPAESDMPQLGEDLISDGRLAFATDPLLAESTVTALDYSLPVNTQGTPSDTNADPEITVADPGPIGEETPGWKRDVVAASQTSDSSGRTDELAGRAPGQTDSSTVPELWQPVDLGTNGRSDANVGGRVGVVPETPIQNGPDVTNRRQQPASSINPSENLLSALPGSTNIKATSNTENRILPAATVQTPTNTLAINPPTIGSQTTSGGAGTSIAKGNVLSKPGQIVAEAVVQTPVPRGDMPAGWPQIPNANLRQGSAATSAVQNQVTENTKLTRSPDLSEPKVVLSTMQRATNQAPISAVPPLAVDSGVQQSNPLTARQNIDRQGGSVTTDAPNTATPSRSIDTQLIWGQVQRQVVPPETGKIQAGTPQTADALPEVRQYRPAEVFQASEKSSQAPISAKIVMADITGQSQRDNGSAQETGPKTGAVSTASTKSELPFPPQPQPQPQPQNVATTPPQTPPVIMPPPQMVSTLQNGGGTGKDSDLTVGEISGLVDELIQQSSIDSPRRDAVQQTTDIRLSRHVVAQLVDVARQLPDRAIEISLNPEELGRVKMTINASDGAISVALAVERGETADLLRRNLETLAAEFKELGYSDISFSFSGGDAQQKNEGGHADGTPTLQSEIPILDTNTPVPARVTLGGSIDIRL